MMSNVVEEKPLITSCVTDAGTRSYAWYPMYVSYSRELVVRDALDKAGVRNFLPMDRVTERVGKKLVHTLQPLVHNLIFVYSDRAQLRNLKMFNRDCTHLQFMTIRPRNDEQASVVITIPSSRDIEFIEEK